MSRGVFELLGENKNISLHKLTVMMSWQSFDRSSVVPSSGDFCRRPPQKASGRDQEFERKKKHLVGCLVDPFASCGRSSACGSLRDFFNI